MIRRSYAIDEAMWLQAQAKAKASGFSMSAIIRALLKLWLQGKVEIQI